MYPDNTTIPPTKRCPNCERELPATKENFYPNKRGKYGLHSVCKLCKAAAERRRNLENPEKYKARYKENYQKSKERHDEKMRQWYKAHSIEHREQGKRWYQQNPAYNTAFMRKWRKENPEKAKAAKQRRRALRVKAQGSHTEKDVRHMRECQRDRCYYCGKEFENGKYHVDHVIPLSRGGSNSPDNLVLACPSCNVQKNNRLPHEWLKGGRLL